MERHTMRNLILIFALGSMLVFASGCLTRRDAVYLSRGDPVRLRQTVRSVKVWVYGQSGRLQEAVIDLPEGSYVVADLDQPTVAEINIGE